MTTPTATGDYFGEVVTAASGAAAILPALLAS